MFVYQGKTALITGASSGIGAAFARALAARGMGVVLVARSQDKLNALADELVKKYAVRIEVIPADLGQEQSVSFVQQEVARRGLSVDVLVNNAGFATHGYFDEIKAERDHEEVMVNVTAVVDLTHAFLPAMVQRGDGGIINIASTAAFQPMPYMPVYGASKAFVLSFSTALAQEYRQRGIHIVALCPGPTDTPFFEVVSEEASFGRRRTVDQVIATGLHAFERGQSVVIDGTSNFLLAQSGRFAPRAFAARLAGRLVHPTETQVSTKTTSSVSL
jgi:uncharacterized protein